MNKIKAAKVIFGAAIGILFMMIWIPPIVHLFDRNDVWVGFVPLSQAFVFLVPFLAAVLLMILWCVEYKPWKKEEQAGGDNNG